MNMRAQFSQRRQLVPGPKYCRRS